MTDLVTGLKARISYAKKIRAVNALFLNDKRFNKAFRAMVRNQYKFANATVKKLEHDKNSEMKKMTRKGKTRKK